MGVFLKRLKKESIRICSITRRPGEHLWHLFGKEQHRIGADMFNDSDAFGTPGRLLVPVEVSIALPMALPIVLPLEMSVELALDRPVTFVCLVDAFATSLSRRMDTFWTPLHVFWKPLGRLLNPWTAKIVKKDSALICAMTRRLPEAKR